MCWNKNVAWREILLTGPKMSIETLAAHPRSFRKPTRSCCYMTASNGHFNSIAESPLLPKFFPGRLRGVTALATEEGQ